MEKYNNLTVLSHPLIRHKIACLRDVNTKMKEFRELIEEITTLMAYESLKDIPTTTKIVRTPLEECEQQMVIENSIAIVPILRAGLGMVNGIHSLLPTAKVGHIGMYRDEETMQPKDYYYKLPLGVENMKVILLDPMLATGGSASASIAFLKQKNVKDITLMSIIAAPEGATAVAKEHPDVAIYIANMDRELNKHCYILPGLGDAGDRLFGTK